MIGAMADPSSQMRELKKAPSMKKAPSIQMRE
jgi:hypothetical protein